MEIKFETVKENMAKYGYFATEELQYCAFLGLLNFDAKKQHAGQDIYAVCLEGPPGAGKTEYAKIYSKLVKDIWNGNAIMVEYQCDATTGKTELFEDINISAVIRGDADRVNIPGKLIEAIKLVNEGKKVVLFLDEYDKAKEETDAFLLQFLQSGKINSSQHGDLEIKSEFKQNLQVILCKNDARETLSGPLSRRIKFIRLDHMKPEDFYAVATRKLIAERSGANKVNESLVDFVSLIYKSVYEKKDEYLRLPACSEMLMAIEEADDLQKFAHAPDHIVYRTIMENLFKDKVDYDTFESKMKNGTSNLAKIIKEMKKSKPANPENKNLADLIAENALKTQLAETNKKKGELDEQIAKVTAFFNEQTDRFKALEAQRKASVEEENKKIALTGQTELIPTNMPHPLSNFKYATPSIRRGEKIFSNGNENWTSFYGTSLTDGEQNTFIKNMRYIAQDNDSITTYEDGYLLLNDNGLKVALVREEQDGEIWMKFYSNTFAVPTSVLGDAIELSLHLQEQTVEHKISHNGIVYSKAPNENLTKIGENLYQLADTCPAVNNPLPANLSTLVTSLNESASGEDSAREVVALTENLCKGGGKC